MLTVEQLDALNDKLFERLTIANRTGELETMLASWGMSDLLEPEEVLQTFKDGKILVLGSCEVKPNILLTVANKAGIDTNRIELCLDYDAVKTFNYKKLQYNPNYRVIIVSAAPHKTVGTGDSSGIISELENTEGYPRVVRALAGNELKLTKSGFKRVIDNLIAENYI